MSSELSKEILEVAAYLIFININLRAQYLHNIYIFSKSISTGTSVQKKSVILPAERGIPQHHQSL